VLRARTHPPAQPNPQHHPPSSAYQSEGREWQITTLKITMCCCCFCCSLNYKSKRLIDTPDTHNIPLPPFVHSETPQIGNQTQSKQVSRSKQTELTKYHPLTPISIPFTPFRIQYLDKTDIICRTKHQVEGKQSKTIQNPRVSEVETGIKAEEKVVSY